MISVDLYRVVREERGEISKANLETWQNCLIGNEIGKDNTSSLETVRLKQGWKSIPLYHKVTTKYYIIIDGNPYFKVNDTKKKLYYPKTAIAILPMEQYYIWNEYNNDVIMYVVSTPVWNSEDDFYV